MGHLESPASVGKYLLDIRGVERGAGQGEKQWTVGFALWTCRNVPLLQDPRKPPSGWPVMLCFAVVGLHAFAFGPVNVIQRTNKQGSQMLGVS